MDERKWKRWGKDRDVFNIHPVETDGDELLSMYWSCKKTVKR